jgi:uncharacterized membrane-anchored protein
MQPSDSTSHAHRSTDPRDGNRRMRTLLVAAAFAVQLIIIGSVIIGPLITTMTGQTIRLAVAPVDPRDPLRGDYLAVAYKINSLSEDFGDLKLTTGQTVWVPLSREGAVWVQSAEVYTHQPSYQELRRLKSAVAIKGKVVSAKDRTVDYGIDRYFVAEGKGMTFPQGTVVAQVKLGKDGSPVLTQIYVDGKAWP